MKLTLLFVAMDLLVLLAYPPVFLHGKWRQFVRSREAVGPTNRTLMIPSNKFTVPYKVEKMRPGQYAYTKD